MFLNERRPRTSVEIQGPFLMSDELIELLRERVAQQYYNQPQVIDVIARAILNSRGLYLTLS
jgi:hypothetical protein